MPNGVYGGVGGKGAKKTSRSPHTRSNSIFYVLLEIIKQFNEAFGISHTKNCQSKEVK